MNPLLFAAVAAAGGVGAGLRFLLDLAVTGVLRTRFPWGIMLVNVTGSFALGVVTGASLSPDLTWVVGTGLLGGYTTFSAVAAESWLLAEERRRPAAVVNAVGTALACIAAGTLGLVLTAH